VAIARGVHARLAEHPYAFSRIDGADRVVIALDVPAGSHVPVGGAFAEGAAVRDGATGASYVVHGGAVTIPAAGRAVLLESQAR
jgi:alpha-amylase